MSALIAREVAVVTARTLGCAAIGIAGGHFGVLFLGALGLTGGMLASESAKKALEFGVENSVGVLAELGLLSLSERERDDPLEGIFRNAARRALQSIHNPLKASSTSIAPSSPAFYNEWFLNWDKALEHLPSEDFEQISSRPATREEWLQRLSSALALLNAQGRMLADKSDKCNGEQPASGRYLVSFTPGQFEPPPDDLVNLVAAKLPTLLPPIFNALLRENRHQEAYKSYVISFIQTFQDRYGAAIEEIRALAEETNERTLQIAQATSQIPAIAENVQVLNAKIDTITGLEFAPIPQFFGLIRASLSPDEGRLNSLFLPTENDYKAKRIYRPAAADDVLRHLQQSGRALVRGVGASGKTVLAWLLGLEAAEQQRPAYYLDFARYEQMPPEIANALIEDLHRFAHSKSLFVLDNCHLDEHVAKQVALGWEDIQREKRPMLLLVAREVRSSRGSPIEGLSIPTIPLRARQPEVLGIYRRLAGRHAGAGEPPNPPLGALDDWVRTFGGDPESEETTTDLIAFSAAVIRRMSQLLRKNWTLTAQDAIEEISEAYLAKLTPNEIQNLILLCACQEVELSLSQEALEYRTEGLRKCTMQLGLAFRLESGRSSWVQYKLAHAALADLIFAAASPPIERTAYRIQASLRSAYFGTACVSRLNALGREDEARLVANQMLTQPECLARIGAVNYLHSFLSQLNWLGVSLPRDADGVLALPKSRQRLLDRALDTQLNALASFLGYASKSAELKGIYARLAEDLAKKENWQRLLDRALDTQLDHLAYFLGYASKELKDVHSALIQELTKSDHRRILVAALEKQPLEKVMSFLSSESACDLEVSITDLDLERWDEARSTDATPNLDAFVSFRRMAEQNGRPELSAVPAMRLIVGAISMDWHRPGIGMHHLSHVLRSARGVSSEEIEQFLNRIATPFWVDKQIESAPVGGLAGALLALASTLDPEKYRWFQRKALLKRLLMELRNIQTCPPESCAEILSLLGAAHALGRTLPKVKAGWPSAEKLAEVIRLRTPAPDTTTISHLQAQLWLGLHEMARSRSDMVTVPRPEADRILELWEATLEREDQLPPPHINIRNRKMVDWLRRCKTAGWSLVTPTIE